MPTRPTLATIAALGVFAPLAVPLKVVPTSVYPGGSAEAAKN